MFECEAGNSTLVARESPCSYLENQKLERLATPSSGGDGKAGSRPFAAQESAQTSKVLWGKPYYQAQPRKIRQEILYPTADFDTPMDGEFVFGTREVKKAIPM